MSTTKYLFHGTTAQLQAELEVADIQHWTEKKKPALLIIHLHSAPIGFAQTRVKGRGGKPKLVTAKRRTSQDKTASENFRISDTIKAIEQDGGVIRLEVELEDDPAKPGYAKVHQRWATLRKQLGERLERTNAKRGKPKYLRITSDEIVQETISDIPAEVADVERLLRRSVSSDSQVFSTDWWGRVTIDSGDETLKVLLEETTWQGMGVSRPADRGVQFLCILDATYTPMLPTPFVEATGANDGHRRLMDIQIYRLDEKRSEVVFTRYSNAGPIESLQQRMIDNIRRAWLTDTPVAGKNWDDRSEHDPISVNEARTLPDLGFEHTVQHDENTENLTRAELKIAWYLAQGYRKVEIAKKLMVEPATVKTHCRNISIKWNLGTTTTATMQHAARERFIV